MEEKENPGFWAGIGAAIAGIFSGLKRTPEEKDQIKRDKLDRKEDEIKKRFQYKWLRRFLRKINKEKQPGK